MHTKRLTFAKSVGTKSTIRKPEAQQDIDDLNPIQSQVADQTTTNIFLKAFDPKQNG